jgi:hypothetical protein
MAELESIILFQLEHTQIGRLPSRVVLAGGFRKNLLKPLLDGIRYEDAC